MAFDGSSWNEASPVNQDLATEIDDNMRDMKAGVSGRMRQEHVWPVSQTATSQAGYHSYITLQGQTGAPTLPLVGTTTQLAAIWVSSGSKVAFIMDSSAGSYPIASFQSTTGTQGGVVICGSDGAHVRVAAPGSPGDVLQSNGTTADASFANRRTVNAWVNFSGGSGGVLDSFNVSGVSKNATGSWTVTFSTAFLDTNYAVFCSASESAGTLVCVSYSGKATGTIIAKAQANGGAGIDPPNYSLIAVGSM